MSCKYWKTDTFLNLKRKWYSILERSGFMDVENELGLKCSSSQLVKYYSPGKAEYYYKCRQFLELGQFDSELDKKIWSLYSEGFGCRKISRRLKSVGTEISKSSVNTIVRMLENRMLEAFK